MNLSIFKKDQSNTSKTNLNGEKPVLTNRQKTTKELRSIFFIILGVFIFRSIIFEPFKIPSGSMIPTLMIGDFILVNKLEYGFKIPFSDMFSDPIYIGPSGKPKRGDVIVFKYPQDTSLNYIKRVIGLPGETVEIRDSVVFVNGAPLAVQEIEGVEIMDDMDDKYKVYNLRFFKSEMEGRNFVLQTNEDSLYTTKFGPVEIPDGHYFVLGDNRDFSADSRYWGFVPFGHIKGRALMVWFSMILPFGEDSFKFRPWRIGTPID
jgi:signal peptidase I